MKTYIALIRGINVGGHNKLPMAILREELERSGLEKVKTYIQSGNVIFRSELDSLKEIELKVVSVINSKFDLDVPVIIKTPHELQNIIEKCPFSNKQKEQSYFVLLNTTPEKKLVDLVSELSFNNEIFQIKDNCIYFYAKDGYGRTKFNLKSFEKKLKVIGTARNYKTMLKLMGLSAVE